jgi:hypothetical protein
MGLGDPLRVPFRAFVRVAIMRCCLRRQLRRQAVVPLNGFEAWIEATSERSFLSSQRYATDAVYPDGSSRITNFSHTPWLLWIYRIDDENEIEHGVVVEPGCPTTNVYWRYLKGAGRL